MAIIMLYSKKNEPLTKELFENPTSEYRGTPFWAWNSTLDKKVLNKEIEYMKEMGFGGFHMHVRVGLATKYLSDEFMDFVKNCVDKAKSENMLAWLYDEDKWPSGYAGGYITKKIENRAKYLLLTKQPYGIGAEDNNDSRATSSRTENGYLVAKYDIELDDNGCLKNYRKLDENESGKNVWYVYLETQTTSPWFNLQSYADTLSKPTIEDFIKVTHERYKECIGDEFGKTVPAIFTDEPQISDKRMLNTADSFDDASLPFTYDFAKTYEETYHEDFFEKLPELFWELPEGVSAARYRYHDHCAERFACAFADTIGEWCGKNNIMLTGHMMNEPTLESQNRAVGDCMRSYRGFQLPGIDMLCDSRELTTAKQAQSAVHQYGREGMLSELYGVTNWNYEFKKHKTQGDWEAVLGVTVRVPHLYWMSMHGEAKRDYPASIGHQSPWYKQYKYIENHFARVNTAMTRGKPDVKVAVVHPVESYWLKFGPNEQVADAKQELNEQFLNCCEWLLYGLVDFDYICEANLPKQANGTKIGRMQYDTIIVPNLITIRSTTIKFLKEFKANGGKVVFAGKIPEYVDAAPSDEAGKIAQSCETAGWSKTQLLNSVKNNRDVDIIDDEGIRASNLMYQMRKETDKKWIFIAHINNVDDDYEADCEEYTIILNGEFKPTLYNTVNGKILPMHAEYKSGKTLINCRMYCQDSMLIELIPGVSNVKAVPEASYEYIGEIPNSVDVELEEPNVLLLDMPQYSLNGSEWREKEEILRICDKLKKELHYQNAIAGAAQPWIFAGEKDNESSNIKLKYVINSEVEVENAEVALEDFEETELEFNGKNVEMKPCGNYVDFSIKKVKLGKLLKGENILILSRSFTKVSTLESLYLLGDFGVKVFGRNAVITEPVRKLCFGSIVNQGLPFYGGNIKYKCEIEAGKDTAISIPHFYQPVLSVDVDSKRIGTIAVSPFRLDLGDIEEGKHLLEITAYGNRINTFGPVHNCDTANKWFGPDGFRTREAKWSYEYRLHDCGIEVTPFLSKKK